MYHLLQGNTFQLHYTYVIRYPGEQANAHFWRRVWVFGKDVHKNINLFLRSHNVLSSLHVPWLPSPP